ncbi:MAG: pilus assembly protein PilM, partial [Candidatus Omnitrophota bacterium]|nr:pilus assembly protein PilM [Candidatus Omnitrophota bacterium]
KGAGPRALIGAHVTPLQAGQEVDASEALKSAVGALQLPLRTMNIAVSGQWVIIRVVEMPTMKPAEMKQALPFEAQRYLPFPVQDVVIDGVALGPADANKMWVLIVACKKELLDRRIDWAKRAGCDVALIDVDALALANSYLAHTNGRSGAGARALINVGAQMTNLVVVRGDVPYLVRDIPWGGDKLARGTADQLGIEVDAVKKELLQGQVSREVQEAMRLASESLSAELQLSFDYFENRFGQPPEEILVSGGLSLCSGFFEALKSHVTQTVSPWAPMSGLSGHYAVAYGLALRVA